MTTLINIDRICTAGHAYLDQMEEYAARVHCHTPGCHGNIKPAGSACVRSRTLCPRCEARRRQAQRHKQYSTTGD